ncbi:hypothetical protein RRG08_019893 [Elysia crispata]|uniref:Uncharacterized protein n=1 Tax=Elysia crispata TaxID=231223 RepID=A0AAE0Z9B0_9GAST|nr:hypothetical protein RRG08_019893 [Elysia crispata]
MTLMRGTGAKGTAVLDIDTAGLAQVDGSWLHEYRSNSIDDVRVESCRLAREVTVPIDVLPTVDAKLMRVRRCVKVNSRNESMVLIFMSSTFLQGRNISIHYRPKLS